MQTYFDIFPIQDCEQFEYGKKEVFGYGRHIKATAEQLKCAIIDLVIDKDETFVFTINNNGKYEKYCMYSQDDYMFNKFKKMYDENYEKDKNIVFLDKILLNPKYKKYILQKMQTEKQEVEKNGTEKKEMQTEKQEVEKNGTEKKEMEMEMEKQQMNPDDMKQFQQLIQQLLL